ncbi:MAG: AAA family ATPase, partial [Deltaproteobacteria bacterium]|nr:AAA family ATPase [Deltaproteobacteria bacterium]
MSHIITIFGGKDGVGKSVFAANFAATYFKQLRKKTLIIDLDAHQCGDIALIFAQSIKTTLASFAKSANAGFDVLKDCIAIHSSGLHLIQAYREEAEKRELSVHFMERAFRELSTHYDLIVIDAGSQFSPYIAKAFELSTSIFIVTEPQVLTLSQTKKAIEKIKNMLFPKEMIKVILNRYKKESLITPQMAAKSIDFPLFAAIEEDEQTCAYSVARGQPFALFQTRTTVAQGYSHLVSVLDQRKVLESLVSLRKPQASVRVAEEEDVLEGTGTTGPTQVRSFRRSARRQTLDDPRTKLKLRIHEQLVEALNLKKMDTAEIESDPVKKEALRDKTKKAILDLLEKENINVVSLMDKKNVVHEILDEALGLGPLENFLADDEVTEIMVNAKDQ